MVQFRWDVMIMMGVLDHLADVRAYSPANMNKLRSTKTTLMGSSSSSTPSIIDTVRMIRMDRLHSETSTNAEAVLNMSIGKKHTLMHDLNLNIFEDDSKTDNINDITEDHTMAQKVKEQSIASLQKATGSEVVDVELQLQMEAAQRRANESNHSTLTSYATAFIDSHLTDASPSEKFAMEMIPSQLPAPVQSKAVAPITQNIKKAKILRRSDMINKDFASSKEVKRIPQKSSANVHIEGNRARRNSRNPQKSTRVTPEEEIKLAQIIQKGAKIHSIKAEFEKKHGREISRAEWVKLAGLNSPKTLRQLVSAYRRAKNDLVTANLGLVYAVVRQGPYMKNTGLSQEELVQEGTLGLIRAAELFDPDKGLRFSTYATIWIKGVLGNSNIHQPIALPSREKTKWIKIQRAQSDLKAMKNGSGDMEEVEITPEEISKATSIPVNEVVDLLFKMPRASNMLSLDFQYKGTTRSGTQQDSSSNLYGNKALEENDLMETLQMKADIVAALARNLEPREARLMRLRYGLHDGKMRTLVECAECMGLSRQRVQQLAVKCLEKLREANDCKSLQEYLLTVA